VAVFVFFAVYQKKKFRHRLEKQQLQTNFQQTLLQTQLEIQEQTLQNLAQEIHDNIGQILSLAKFNLGTIHSENSDTLQKIEDSRNLVGRAIQDLRNLSKSLSSDYVSETGFLHSVGFILESIRKSGALSAQLQVTGDSYKLGPHKELLLLRIIQEAISNIITHARATMITIHICFEPHAFTLSVNDNGKGFNNSQALSAENTGSGIGIRNMQKRAGLIGAEFQINGSNGAGTTIKVIVPV